MFVLYTYKDGLINQIYVKRMLKIYTVAYIVEESLNS